MQWICPHCRTENKVAGWRGWEYQLDGKKHEGYLHCWKCGKQVTQEQLEKKEKKDGFTGTV